MFKKSAIKVLMITSAICFSSNMAYAQFQSSAPSLGGFIPAPKTKTSIDYSAMDLLLGTMVLNSGLSTRRTADKPSPTGGTNIIIGHTSPYRLEGNKIVFSRFTPAYLNLISEYRQELEDISKQINIANLPRNEQLAFWTNLHNIAMIEQIALAYPVKTPTKIKINIDGKDVPLNEAKILNVNDTKLSLRNIREDIVYKNWNDPIVQYGFFLGSVGSPSIQNFAYTGKNIQTLLNVNAYEFTNSLRGFRKGFISAIYKDNASFFFPDFNNDVTEHFTTYMRPQVVAELRSYPNLKVARFESIIADTSAGTNNRTQGLPSSAIYEIDSISQDTLNSAIRTPNTGANTVYLREITEKKKTLKKLGLSNTGTVVIEDIEEIINDEKSPIID